MTQNKITKIKKRDGTVVEFEEIKIRNAIFKAITATGQGDGEQTKKVLGKVIQILNRRFKKDEIPSVEQIQDIIEEVLILEDFVETAKAYILYREQRRKIREAVAISEEAVERVDQYLEKLDWEVKENANMAFSLQGLNHYGVSGIVKKYWLNKIYPKEVREANESGDLHLHNLDTLAVYCSGWDLYDLLLKGFGGVPGKMSSKPAKHFRSALGQAVNFLFTITGEVAGAVSFSNFDTLLAPFIRYDNLNYQQTKQALQEFLFNMATPTRVGFQNPFSNITLDLRPSSVFAKQPVIIGGKPQEETYSEFEEEMKIFNKALYEAMLEGDKDNRPFSFPIPTINITKDFPWDEPAFEGIFEASAKYGINYFSNYINSDMSPEDARSMCPLGGDEKVLIKSSRGRGLEYSSIKYIFKGHSKQNEYWIYSDGRFVNGKFNKFKNQEMMRVTLVNNHQIEMSAKHLNFVMENENSKMKVLLGEELKQGMYLPYSLQVYKGRGGNRESGYFVGAFAGDGSFIEDTTIVFSLSKKGKESVIEKLQTVAEKYFGAHSVIAPHPKTNLLTLRVNSRAAVGLCRDFVIGKQREKHYAPKIFEMSEEFRRGVIEGHLDTDGNSQNRIYTSSPKMVERLNMLTATLGTTTSIYKDEREGRLGSNPNFAVLIYKLNRKKLENIWFKKYEKLWMKIKSIKKLPYKINAYCFEVKNDEPIFTIGTTGILTHNCRLKLDLRELRNRGGGGLFGSGSNTGSIGVVTANLPRIGYLSKTKKDFFQRLGEIMDLAKESLEIKRKTIENFIEKGLYPYSRVYLQGIKKMRGAYYANHFATIGLVGMNEALLNFISDNIASKRGRRFTIEILDFMREKLVKYQKETGNIYNLEQTPAESSLAPCEKVLVSQSDPKLTEIGPLVDKYLEENKEKIQIIGRSEILPLPEGELFTYGFSREDQKIKKYPATALIRHPGDSMYEIKTVSGRKVRVTQYHSVFSLHREGVPQEVKVCNLKIGDVIAIPKKIEMENQYYEFNLIEEFKKHFSIRDNLYLKTTQEIVEKLILEEKVKNWAKNYYAFEWKDAKYWWKKKKIIPLKLIYDLNISLDRETLKHSLVFYRKSKNTYPIKTLIKCDRNLGFIIGALLAEGWLNTDRIEITNTDQKFIKEISLATQKAFDKKSYHLSKIAKIDRRGNKRLYILTLNKITTLVMKEVLKVKGKSGQKSIPCFSYFASQDFVTGLLKGFSLGDGSEYFNKEKSDYTYRLYTNSKELLEGLNILLLKLGILAKIKIDRKDRYNSQWKKNYVLSISGIDNLQRFYFLVLQKDFKGEIKNSGREKIPKVAKTLKELIKKEGVKKKDLEKMGIWQSTLDGCVRKNSISIEQLKKIIEKLEKRIKSPLLRVLKTLVEGDLYWDPIKTIKKIKTPKYVYDFEVDAEGGLVENFLGGQGLVCLHNTAYRLALKDREKYPDIIVAGTKKTPFYTNSTQLPVNYTDDMFEALKLQDEITCKYTGGCIEGGNRVLTDKGLLNIEYIIKNFKKLRPIKALSYNPEKKVSEWDEIVEAIPINVKKHNKIRVKGERNLDIVTSDWHPFFVLEKVRVNPTCPVCEEKVGNIKGFAVHLRYQPECREEYQILPKYQVIEKRADELEIGDYILQNSHNLYSEEKTELNNDLMWLLGFFIGDGCISKFTDNRGGNNLKRYRVRFFSEHQEALYKVVKILNKYFYCQVRVLENKKRNETLKRVATSKKEVLDFLFKYGFQDGEKAYNVFISPKIKENLNKKNVFSFLSGLMDSDGHITKRDGDFEYYTVSSKLADDIFEICTIAGIMISKILKPSQKRNEVDIWRLRIPQYEMTKMKHQLTNTIHSSDIKENLSNRKKRYLPVVRVKEVSKVNVKDNQFYDLMTKKNHNYLAGKDCLVFIHNSVLHLFLGERVSDIQTVKSLIKKIFEKFHLPYVTITPTFSICPSHGYLSGEHFECPKCTIKQPCEVYSRVVGYLRPIKQWNTGKQQEFKERKEFKL